jgi:hypothetical protein
MTKKVLSKPLEFYSRNIATFFKKCQIKVTTDLEQKFIYNYDFLDKLVSVLLNSNLKLIQLKYFFEEVVCEIESRSYEERDCFSKFRELINKYNYETLPLVKYLVEYLQPFENLSSSKAMGLLRDYIMMASKIGREVKKYPKYLSSMHDIITANFNAFKTKYNERLFLERRKAELEFVEKDFLIITPQNTREIVEEGTCLNHCVSSYIDKILDGETYIFFLRKKESPEMPMVTLELIDNKLVNAKGSYNRTITEEEGKFLNKFCEIKQLKCEVKT